MSSIQFRNISKGDLPQYSYTFGEREPLGKEMNNVACTRLGTMLHLDIQKGKEAMKTPKFQKYIRGTTTCMKRLSIATKRRGQLTSNDTKFSDSWFSYVKTTEDMAAAGVNCCRTVKTSHKVFFLSSKI